MGVEQTPRKRGRTNANPEAADSFARDLVWLPKK